MIVYNKTELTKDEAFESLVKETRSSYMYRFILGIIVTLCGIGLLFFGYLNKQNDYIVVGYLFLVFGLLYFLMSIYAILKAPKKVYLKNKEICDNGITYNYTFKEQSFEVLVISNDKKNKLPYKYYDIKKIKEYEDKYQFNLKSRLILYVKKSGFENQKMEEFFKKNVAINKIKIKNKIKVENN